MMPLSKDFLKNIKLPKTKFEKIYNVITAILVVLLIIFVVFIWREIPQTIPTHYDALGRPDDEGSKWLVLIGPVIMLSYLSMMRLFAKHPEWWNYPQRMNETNAPAFYLINRQLMTATNNGGILLFSLVALEMILVVLDWIPQIINIGVFALLIVVLFGVPMLLFALKIRKIK